MQQERMRQQRRRTEKRLSLAIANCATGKRPAAAGAGIIFFVKDHGRQVLFRDVELALQLVLLLGGRR